MELQLQVKTIDWGEPSGSIHLELGNAARVSIQRNNGKFYFQPGSMAHMVAGLGVFYGRDRVTLGYECLLVMKPQRGGSNDVSSMLLSSP